MATTAENIPASHRQGERETKIIGARQFAPKNIIAYLFLLAMVVYSLTPLWYLMVTSTKDNTDIGATFGLTFASHFALLENLKDTFTYGGGEYGQWLINSVFYGVGGAAVGMFISVMAGYALAKYKFVGRGLLFGLVIGAALVPSNTLALPIYLEETKLGLLNTYWGFLLPSLLNPLGVFLGRVYATSAVNDDLLHAARIDGASEIRIFFSVALPLMVPGMITIFLFQFVSIWNSFFLPLIVLTDPKLFPVNLGLATWTFSPGAHEILNNQIMIGSLIAVLPLIVMFLFLQRYWRAGLSFGSTTG